jgi:hypothetical protein
MSRSSRAGWPPSGASPRWPAARPTRAPRWTRTAAAAGGGQLGSGRGCGGERGAGPDRERGDLIAGEAATLHLGGGAQSRSAPAGAPLPGRPPRRRRILEHHPVGVIEEPQPLPAGLLQSHRRRGRRRTPGARRWGAPLLLSPMVLQNVAMVDLRSRFMLPWWMSWRRFFLCCGCRV